MNLLIGLVLLFAPVPPVRVYDATPAKQQAVQVGGHVTPADVQKAKAVLAAAEPKELKLKVGEFEIIDDHRAGKIVVNLNGRLNKVRFPHLFSYLYIYLVSPTIILSINS